MGLYANKLMLEQKQENAFIQAINEVYFGRTASINSLFNAYCDWREPLLTTNPKLWTHPGRNFYNKEHHIFEEMTCKQFGFNTFSYQIGSDNRINSATVAYGLLPFGASSREIEITKDGYRFKDSAKFNSIIIVYPSLAFNPEFTNEEAFAVFLHEVGHNFQAAANNTIFCLSAATGIFKVLTTVMKEGPVEGLYQLLLTSNIMRGSVNILDNALTRNEFTSNFLVCVNMMLYSLKHCTQVFNWLSNILLVPISRIYSIISLLPDFLISVITGKHARDYYGERFADSFAASYGFGEAAATGETKFDNIVSGDPTVDILFNDIPVFSHVLQLAMLPSSLLIGIIDVHPDTASRCASVLKDMKRDLNDPKLDPKLKKQLAKEVDAYERAMNEYYEEATKIKNPGVVGAFIQKYIYQFGGDIKMKLSELPFMRIGGFGAQTNRNTSNIIANTKIK